MSVSHMSWDHAVKIKKAILCKQEICLGTMERLLTPKSKTELKLKLRSSPTSVKHSVLGNHVVSAFLANSFPVTLHGVLMCHAHFHRTFCSRRRLVGKPIRGNQFHQLCSSTNKLSVCLKKQCVQIKNNNKVSQVSWKQWMAMRHRFNQRDISKSILEIYVPMWLPEKAIAFLTKINWFR